MNQRGDELKVGTFPAGVCGRGDGGLGRDAADLDGEVLGVAEEVGIGGQDLEVLHGGHGAYQEIGGGALEALLAAVVAELGGLDEMWRRQGDVFKSRQRLVELAEMLNDCPRAVNVRRGAHFLCDSGDINLLTEERAVL